MKNRCSKYSAQRFKDVTNFPVLLDLYRRPRWNWDVVGAAGQMLYRDIFTIIGVGVGVERWPASLFPDKHGFNLHLRIWGVGIIWVNHPCKYIALHIRGTRTQSITLPFPMQVGIPHSLYTHIMLLLVRGGCKLPQVTSASKSSCSG